MYKKYRKKLYELYPPPNICLGLGSQPKRWLAAREIDFAPGPSLLLRARFADSVRITRSQEKSDSDLLMPSSASRKAWNCVRRVAGSCGEDEDGDRFAGLPKPARGVCEGEESGKPNTDRPGDELERS